jgi:pimeloyl-ACP methyl ester carboxylesterase
MSLATPRPVFIHGSGGCRESWHLQTPRFAGAVYEALEGHPDGIPHPMVGSHAQDLASLLAETDGPYVLVGHSLGGAVALQTAYEHPQRIAGIVLVTTGARLPVPDHVFDRLHEDFPGECERVVRAGLVREHPDVVAAGLARMFAMGEFTLMADYLACAGFDARDWLHEVDMPTLVIAGSEDPLTPLWMSEELAEKIPGARLAVIRGASHGLIEEHADEFNLLIAGFLAKVAQT